LPAGARTIGVRWAAGLVIEAAGIWVPSTSQSAADAVASGRLTTDDAEKVAYATLPVSVELAAPEMAVLAAVRALDAAGRHPSEVQLLVHAWTHFQGHDFWSPAHYVAQHLGARNAVPAGIQQMCNGGAFGLDVAAARLTVDPSVQVAVVTTADRFCEPGFDRWNADYGLWYGDGATAAVLSRGAAVPGSLELVATTTAAAPELESMHRGTAGFSDGARSRIDVRATKKAFLAVVSKEAFAACVEGHVRDVVRRGAAEAEIELDDPALRCVALPRLGRSGLGGFYEPVVSSLTPARLVDDGRHTGHLGAGDVIANLALLTEEDLLRPGDTALVLSAGAGFTWSCVAVRRPVAIRTPEERLQHVS
jgi:3-oxoacyl-[acyl-carrier-protein] synthase-3